MEFRFTAEEEAFRLEVREFLKQELPPDWQDQFDPDHGAARGTAVGVRAAVQQEARAAGLAGDALAHGVRRPEASIMQQLIYNEEMAYNGAPRA